MEDLLHVLHWCDLHSMGPGASQVIEADPDLHRAKLEEDAQRTGVWLSRVRPGEIVDEDTGEPATRRLSAKLPTESAVRCEENIEDLGEAIFDHVEADGTATGPRASIPVDRRTQESNFGHCQVLRP